MQLQTDTLENIQRCMDAVKAASAATPVTNYFRQPMTGGKFLAAATDRTVLFANDEFDFYRLYFFTTDLADFENTLRQLEFAGTLVAGYLTRQPDERIDGILVKSGFRQIALYRRMDNPALRVVRTAKSVPFATAEDLDEIYEDALRVFDKYTDHLPTKPALSESIGRRQVILNRQAGRIRGWILFQLLTRKVNFHQLYNASESSLDVLALLLNFYGLMHEQGIRSGILWVNTAKTDVIRLHQNFGWRFDGLEDYFYLRHGAN